MLGSLSRWLKAGVVLSVANTRKNKLVTGRIWNI